MLTGLIRAAPLIGSAVALVGALFAFGTARRAHALAIRATAIEDRRVRSEEAMRLLRWAVELAVSDDLRHRAAGVAALVRARLVVRGDRAFIEAVAGRIALLADGTQYSDDQSLDSSPAGDGGSHG